jgi:hypothetical protein
MIKNTSLCNKNSPITGPITKTRVAHGPLGKDCFQRHNFFLMKNENHQEIKTNMGLKIVFG